MAKKPAPPSEPPKPAGTTPIKKRKKAATPRQKRKKVRAKCAPKFNLQTILSVAGGLKEADMAVFQKTIALLQAAPKAARRRILLAVEKIFS